ncbi:hypothetical protein [Streptomyces zaomyceticus]|uniref:hypothetical protein n=1 Tax=Streptomyces zaomyceticus TaxID=68286 RepID=UPI0036A8A0DC
MGTHDGFRSVRAPAAVAALLLVAGCQSAGPRACTLIGAESGVTFTWDPADFPAGSPYRLCVDRVCRNHPARPSDDPLAFFTVELPEVTGERRVTVRFQVGAPADAPAGERTVYDRTATVTLRKHAPNGERCDPVVWQAAVRADLRHGLVSPERPGATPVTQPAP